MVLELDLGLTIVHINKLKRRNFYEYIKINYDDDTKVLNIELLLNVSSDVWFTS